jgi:RNA polymerase sigma factor for flagellar operon FliA
MNNYDKDFLIMEHMSLAEGIGIKEWKTATHALDRDDMLALAYLGLVDAANRWEAYCARKGYDPSATQFFKVFARLRIRGTIRDSIRSDDWATRTLRSKSKRLKDAGQDEGVSIEELAKKTEMTVAEIHKVNARLASRPVSLDANFQTNSEEAQQESHQLKDKVDTESVAFAQSMMSIFVETFLKLDPAVKVVIALHYYGKLDLRRVAEELEMPEATISKWHAEGVTAVKEALTYAAKERG